MNMGLVVLLLVGVILITANAAKVRAEKTAPDATTAPNGEKIVYKYLPLDLDAFYRQDAISKPSTLYHAMFSNEDLKR